MTNPIHHLELSFMLTLTWPTQGCLTLKFMPLRWRIPFGRWGWGLWGVWNYTRNWHVGTTRFDAGPFGLHYLDNREHIQARRAEAIGLSKEADRG